VETVILTEGYVQYHSAKVESGMRQCQYHSQLSIVLLCDPLRT